MSYSDTELVAALEDAGGDVDTAERLLKSDTKHVFCRNGRSFDERTELAHEKDSAVKDLTIVDVAADYVRSELGREYADFNDFMTLSTKSGKHIADLFDSAVHEPQRDDVANSYRALSAEVVTQWKHLVAVGYTMEPWTGEGDPYETSSANMIEDFCKNNHLWYFPTDMGFGHDDQSAVHPMLEPSGIVIDGKNIPVNDVFRAVHDAFGHAMNSFTFAAKGEYNAYLSHARMFSEAARPALAAETLFQNAWVNFGKHLRRPDGTLPARGDVDWTPPRDRPFAEQKAFNPDGDFLRKLTMATPFRAAPYDPFPQGIVHVYPSVEFSRPRRLLVVLHANTRATGALQQIGKITLDNDTDDRQWRVQRMCMDGEFASDFTLSAWFVSNATKQATRWSVFTV